MALATGIPLLATACYLDPTSEAEQEAKISSSDLTAEEFEFLQRVAPGTEGWHRVVDGLYEAVDTRGGVNHMYVGPAGREFYLLKLHDELRRTEARIAESSGETLQKLSRRASELHEQIDELQAEPTEAQLKTTQSASLVVSGCQHVYDLKSDFTANMVIVDYPEATAESVYSGAFGPPAPGPFTFYRSVSAKVNDITDFVYTHNYSATITAYVQNITFGGSCMFETDHVVAITCWGGEIEDFHALNRKQSCSGVLNDDPIQETRY